MAPHRLVEMPSFRLSLSDEGTGCPAEVEGPLLHPRALYERWVMAVVLAPESGLARCNNLLPGAIPDLVARGEKFSIPRLLILVFEIARTIFAHALLDRGDFGLNRLAGLVTVFDNR